MARLKIMGAVVGKLLEVRFSVSGKLKAVNFHTGDLVKAGDVLASLETKNLQSQLDLELSAYEKTRAQFEIFHNQKTGTDDITKYLSVIEQADLDTSVKRVELAKARLDEAILVSPADGVVTDDGECFPNLNITPASNYFTICPSSEKYFQMEITQDELAEFSRPRSIAVRFKDIQKMYPGSTNGPVPALLSKTNPPKFIVLLKLADGSDLFPGMVGEGELD
jgi:multidrug resistance efflux pump